MRIIGWLVKLGFPFLKGRFKSQHRRYPLVRIVPVSIPQRKVQKWDYRYPDHGTNRKFPFLKGRFKSFVRRLPLSCGAGVSIPQRKVQKWGKRNLPILAMKVSIPQRKVQKCYSGLWSVFLFLVSIPQRKVQKLGNLHVRCGAAGGFHSSKEGSKEEV